MGLGPPHIADVRAVRSPAEQRVEPIYGIIRAVLAQVLDVDEVYLWPELLSEPTPEQRVESVESELVRVFPDRASVPRDTWLQSSPRVAWLA